MAVDIKQIQQLKLLESRVIESALFARVQQLQDISTPLHKQQEEDNTEVEEEDQDQKFDSKYLDKKIAKPQKKVTNANRLLMMHFFDGVNEFKGFEA